MSDENDVHRESSHRIYDELRYPVFTIKVFLQILIGLGLTIAIIVHMAALVGFIEAGSDSDSVHWVKLAAGTHPLKIVSYGLALSAALELAYMLFTPGLDESVMPLLQGLSAGILFFIADLIGGRSIEWHLFLVLAVLLAGIPLLFWVRDTFILRLQARRLARGKSPGKTE